VKSLLADEPLLRDQTGDETHGDALRAQSKSARTLGLTESRQPQQYPAMSALCRFLSIKAGMEEMGYGNRIIQNATKNEQVEFFGQQD
jgi:hypothetical protein